jgi:methionyl aminopeptidase
VGHGIGRELHEPPQVPNVGRKGVGRKLKVGMTICVEPMINQGGPDVETAADHWTVVASDGLASAHYEHMIAIGPDGPDLLTSFDVIEAVIEAPYKQAA